MNNLYEYQSGFISFDHMTVAQRQYYGKRLPYGTHSEYAEYVLRNFNERSIDKPSRHYIQHTYYSAIIFFLLHDLNNFLCIWQKMSKKNRIRWSQDVKNVYSGSRYFYYYPIPEANSIAMFDWTQQNYPELVSHITFMRPIAEWIPRFITNEDARPIIRNLIYNKIYYPNATLSMNPYIDLLNEPEHRIYYNPPVPDDGHELSFICLSDYQQMIGHYLPQPELIQHLLEMNRYDLLRWTAMNYPDQVRAKRGHMIMSIWRLFNLAVEKWVGFEWCYQYSIQNQNWIEIDVHAPIPIGLYLHDHSMDRFDFLYRNHLVHHMCLNNGGEALLHLDTLEPAYRRDNLLYWLKCRRIC